ncbi:signal peptidase II [Nitratireductor sp. L15S-10]|uniref:signal peptidase II n=1 Tax=Nitratireductor sp. L15S-10 TaxID=3034028 RepID=UPI0038576FEA
MSARLVPISVFPQTPSAALLKLSQLEVRAICGLQTTGQLAMMRGTNTTRILVGLICILSAFAIDQFTKTVIVEIIMQPPRVIYVTPFMNIILSYNEGISFGLFSGVFRDWSALLIWMTLALAIVLLIWMIFSDSFVTTAALGLMAGGALGNIYDRVQGGKVTDFIDLHAGSWHWPTFNIADVAIVGGAIILILCSLRFTSSPN